MFPFRVHVRVNGVALFSPVGNHAAMSQKIIAGVLVTALMLAVVAAVMRVFVS